VSIHKEPQYPNGLAKQSDDRKTETTEKLIPRYFTAFRGIWNTKEIKLN